MSTPTGGGQLSDKLRLAASKGQTAKIKELLESGATFDPDKNGRTGVHYAALNGHATTIKACIQQGCDPDTQDVAGRTALHLAVTDGHVEAVTALIEEGCPVDRQDQVNGNTALHEAAWNGYSKSSDVLCTYGRANVHAANRNGMRPLHMAVQNGHNESSRVLLRHGTHPDTRNNHGETPLHIAATHGHVTCCRILISGRSDINAINREGNTPLHVAASLGKRKITKILVEAGCDVNTRNNKGQTAVDVARDHEYPEVIIIIASAPKKAQKARSRQHHQHHHRNQPTEHQSPVIGRREQRARAAEQGMMGTPPGQIPYSRYQNQQYALPTHHGDPKHKSPHGTSPQQPPPPPHQRAPPHGRVSATDATRSGFGPPWQQQNGMSWQQQAWHQWSWQRQQEQEYQHLEGQRQTPLERALEHERRHHHDVQFGRVTGNPHQDSEYYRDAFGNVHERPVSNCNCMPYVRRLENQLEATKEKFMYEIESTTQMMEDKMKYFDKKMLHQSSCLDQLCKERMATERTECLHRIDRRAQKEQAEFERRSTVRINALRRELKGWFEDRFRHFEKKYSDDFGIDLGSDHDHEDDYGEPGGSLLRSKSEGRLPASQTDPAGEKQADPSPQRPTGKLLPDTITATRTLQEVRYAKTKPIESTNDPYVLREESENTATEKSQDSDHGKPAVQPPSKPPKPPKPLPPPRTVSYPSSPPANPNTGAIPKRTASQKWGEPAGNPHSQGDATSSSGKNTGNDLLRVSSTDEQNPTQGQNPATPAAPHPGQNSIGTKGTNLINPVYLYKSPTSPPPPFKKANARTDIPRAHETQGNPQTAGSSPQSNRLQGGMRTDLAPGSNGNLPAPHHHAQPPPLHPNAQRQYAKPAVYQRPNQAHSGGTARFNPNTPRVPTASYSALRTPNHSQHPQTINVSPITVNTSLANASVPSQDSPSTIASSPGSVTPHGDDSLLANNRDSSDSMSTSTLSSSRSRRDPIDPSLAMALLEENDSLETYTREPMQTFSPPPYSQNVTNSLYSPPTRSRPIATFEVRPSQNSQEEHLYTTSGKARPKSDRKIAPKSPGEQVVPNMEDKPRQNGDPHYAVL